MIRGTVVTRGPTRSGQDGAPAAFCRNILRSGVERAREQAPPSGSHGCRDAGDAGVPVTPTGVPDRLAGAGSPGRAGRDLGGFESAGRPRARGSGFRGAGRFRWAGGRPGSAGLAAGSVRRASAAAGSAGLAPGPDRRGPSRRNLRPRPGCTNRSRPCPTSWPNGPTRAGRTRPAAGQANRWASTGWAEPAAGPGQPSRPAGPGQPSRPAGRLGESGTGPGGAPRRLVRRPVAGRAGPAAGAGPADRQAQSAARSACAPRAPSGPSRSANAPPGRPPASHPRGRGHRSVRYRSPRRACRGRTTRRRALRGHRQLGASSTGDVAGRQRLLGRGRSSRWSLARQW